MTTAPTLVWFRQDLRVADHPPLAAALERRGPIIPVYICSPETEGDWPLGAASRWWLQRSLTALAAELRRRGSRLILRRGATGPSADGTNPRDFGRSHLLGAMLRAGGAR